MEDEPWGQTDLGFILAPLIMIFILSINSLICTMEIRIVHAYEYLVGYDLLTEQQLIPSRVVMWRRKWQSTPVFLPGKSRGQRGLVGYSPWGSKKSDMPETAGLHRQRDACDTDNLSDLRGAVTR